VRFGGAREFVIDDAGLDDGALILGVDLENAIHAGEDEHDASGAGERATGEACARTAADDGNVVFGGQPNDAGDFLGGSRKNDDVGAALFDRAVVFIEEDIFRLVENGRFAE
jgi:hypothetical protein